MQTYFQSQLHFNVVGTSLLTLHVSGEFRTKMEKATFPQLLGHSHFLSPSPFLLFTLSLSLVFYIRKMLLTRVNDIV